MRSHYFVSVINFDYLKAIQMNSVRINIILFEKSHPYILFGIKVLEWRV